MSSVVYLPLDGAEPEWVVREFEGYLYSLTHGPGTDLLAVALAQGATELVKIQTDPHRGGWIECLTDFGDVDWTKPLFLHWTEDVALSGSAAAWHEPATWTVTLQRRDNGIWELELRAHPTGLPP